GRLPWHVRELAQSFLRRQIALPGEVARVEVRDVDVPHFRRAESAVKLTPDDVADYARPYPSVREPASCNCLKRADDPGLPEQHPGQPGRCLGLRSRAAMATIVHGHAPIFGCLPWRTALPSQLCRPCWPSVPTTSGQRTRAVPAPSWFSCTKASGTPGCGIR